MIKELINRLKQFFNKVLVEEQNEFYVLTLFKENEPSYLLCIDRTTNNYIYGKITLLSKLSFIDCLESLYTPHGLFIFGRDLNEFINKLVNKLSAIKQ